MKKQQGVFLQRSATWLSALPVITLLTFLIFGCNVGRDQHDVQDAASKIHDQLRTGDFSSIYRNASSNFKRLDERQFTLAMEQMRQQVGALTKATPLAYQTGVDSNVGRSHILISDLEFERGNRARERMVLQQSKDGQMLLWDLLIEPMSIE
jgi:hypothetical protein